MYSQQIENFDKIWFVSFVSLSLAVILVYVINYFDEKNFSIFDNISILFFTIIPTSLVIVSGYALRCKKIYDIPKKSLVFLCLAFVCWFLAEQVWMLYDYVFLLDPFPSIADIFYISAPILMFISLIIFLKPLKNNISKKNVIIATVFSMVLLIPTAYITYEESKDVELFELLVALIYPISDAIVLIPVIITVSFLIQGKKNPFWVMIFVGIFILVAADTLFLLLILIDGYHENHPIDLLWLISYIVWTFSLWRSIHNSKKYFETDTDIKHYKKYESELLSRYGAISFLIIMNVVVVIILFSINYFISFQYDFKIFELFTIFLVMIMVVFSVLIILLNKTMHKNLQIRTSELEKISNEIIKSEKLSAIGQLAANISHDIRNPLFAIKNSIQIIKKRTTDETGKQEIKRINRSIVRIEHQVSQVLDFVRKTPLYIEQISFLHVLNGIIKSLDVPENIIIIQPTNDVDLFIDRVKIESVIYNILINAIQSINLEKKSITITLTDNEYYVKINISNDGPFILDNDLPKIFEPLFTTKQKGTGLGLCGAKNSIEQHGGTISIKNNPVTFTINLPKKLTEDKI